MRKRKENRNKALVTSVEKIGIRKTAVEFNLAPSTVHEIYHREIADFKSDTVRVIHR